MKKISTKLILSFLFLVTFALIISGTVFLLSYTQTLHHSETEGLRKIAEDIFSYSEKNHLFTNSDFYALLQEISNYEEVSIRIKDNENRIVQEIIPNLQQYISPPGMLSPDILDNRGKPFMGREYKRFAEELKESWPQFLQRFDNMKPRASNRQFQQGTVEITIPALQGNSRGTYVVSVFRPQRISDEFLEAAGNGFAVSAIIALIASIFAGILLGKKITTPIISLKQTALTMADGAYHVRAQVHSRDETADLAESFNMLGSNLEKRIQELSDERDSLRNFLADASHELRTPLTTMLTSSEILSERLDLRDTRLAELYQQNHQSILRMKTLVDHLLSLSRLQGGIQNLNLQDCTLKELVATALEHIQGTIQIDIDSTLSSIHVDKLSFTQVLRNCFENSVNAEATRIIVRAVKNENGILLSVRDNGHGIKPENLGRVTERFYRGEGSTGTGLGLAIVEGILSAHGGRVEVLSPPSDGSAEGTELLLHIPQSE